MSDPTLVARLVRIAGRVQGVGYRAWTERETRSRGLSGWVRNRHDGTVEAMFVGAEAAVAAMIEACRTGPRHAQVKTIVDRAVPVPEVAGAVFGDPA